MTEGTREKIEGGEGDLKVWDNTDIVRESAVVGGRCREILNQPFKLRESSMNFDQLHLNARNAILLV